MVLILVADQCVKMIQKAIRLVKSFAQVPDTQMSEHIPVLFCILRLILLLNILLLL